MFFLKARSSPEPSLFPRNRDLAAKCWGSAVHREQQPVVNASLARLDSPRIRYTGYPWILRYLLLVVEICWSSKVRHWLLCPVQVYICLLQALNRLIGSTFSILKLKDFGVFATQSGHLVWRLGLGIPHHCFLPTTFTGGTCRQPPKFTP